MSQLISRRSDSFQLQAQGEPSLGWTGGWLLALPRALLRAARRAWADHSEQRLLRELSDHQLRDIGLSRQQIPHIVRREWDI
ncbi:MAG TPA: DUF1127 domain-containing protein [Dongiaceae bacterium]|jgi:uncharacterized protein YjiS (DUF1127 family)|nr:DUF1127 domain-containing protein [Dongiaceae bacterium]